VELLVSPVELPTLVLPPLTTGTVTAPPIAWSFVKVEPVIVRDPWLYTAPPWPDKPLPLLSTPPWANPLLSVRSSNVRLPVGATVNKRKSAAPADRAMVCPVPSIVIAVDTKKADGPTLVFPTVLKSMVDPARDGAKSIVSC
jgi:hypothetical protein